jgi:hypothetical protein
MSMIRKSQKNLYNILSGEFHSILKIKLYTNETER